MLKRNKGTGEGVFEVVRNDLCTSRTDCMPRIECKAI